MAIVVTNQRCVAKGLLSAANLEKMHEQMSQALLQANAKLDGIYYCPHDYEPACTCRKPGPGMLLEATRRHRHRSWLVMDDRRLRNRCPSGNERRMQNSASLYRERRTQHRQKTCPGPSRNNGDLALGFGPPNPGMGCKTKNSSRKKERDRMIITRTPLRISFFGGGTDYPIWFREFGGAVLSTAID